MKQILYCLLCASALYSCSGSSANSGDGKKSENEFDVSRVKQSIETANKKFSDAFVKGDSATVVNLYHSDAKVFPPNMKEDKRTMMGSMAASGPKMGIKTFSLNTIDVTGNADQVVETGSFEMGDGSKTIDKGKYIVVWKPENGEWKLWRDIWNSDNPTTPLSK
jgi:ketosteroid isomerase-like protein